MTRIDRNYVVVALASLLIGELLGFYMGMTQDLKLRSVHIALVLTGFVTLSLFGFMYRMWPSMKAAALAKAQFWLSVVGALGIAAGTYQYVKTGAIAIVAPASGLLILGTILLLWLFWTRSEAA